MKEPNTFVVAGLNLWPGTNLESQLKQSPFSRLAAISAGVSSLMGRVGKRCPMGVRVIGDGRGNRNRGTEECPVLYLSSTSFAIPIASWRDWGIRDTTHAGSHPINRRGNSWGDSVGWGWWPEWRGTQNLGDMQREWRIASAWIKKLYDSQRMMVRIKAQFGKQTLPM